MAQRFVAMVARFDCVERPLKVVFFRYGRVLSRHPLPFILVPLVVSLVLSVGFLYLERYSNVEYLFTAEDSRVRRAAETVDAFFPQQNRSRNFLRITVVPKNDAKNPDDDDISPRVVVIDKNETETETKENPRSESIWNRESISEIVKLDRKIRQKVVTDATDGKDLMWSDVCEEFLGESGCPAHPVLQLFQYNASVVKNVPVYFPVHTVPLPPPFLPLRLYLPTFLGGVIVNDDNSIQSVKAIRLIYITKKDQGGSIQWEDEIRADILNTDPDAFEHIDVTVMSTTTLDTELTALTQEGLPLMYVLFSVMFTFAVLVSLSADWTIAKPWLAFGGLISACLAIVSAFGFLLFFLPFVDMVTSVPFLALGIGMDDMFVLMASWRKTSQLGSVEDRMCAAMSDAAVSITITTLTDLLAIGVGATSNIPSVRYFCIFAALTVLIDYFFQITFFAGCMVYSGRREMDRKHAITFKPTQPKSESSDRSCCYRLWCTGGTSALHPNAPEDSQELAAMVCFRDGFGKHLMSVPGKVFVCVLYAVYIGVGIWGCLNLRQGLEMTRIVLDDSYANKDFRNWELYFREYSEPAYVVIYDKLDYCSADDRKKISDAIGKFEEHDLYHGAEVSQVWTRDFDEYLVTRNISIDSDETFNRVLEAFLSEPRFRAHRENIKMANDAAKKITASRFVVFPRDLMTPEIKMRLETESREIVDASELNMTITQEFFVFYESWSIVLPATLKNFGIAAGTVLFVCMILIPSPICSIYVALSIVSMSVGLVGFMTFWDVNLDSISMIQVIMAVGFSVDFTAHITYAFCVAPGPSKNDRVCEALYGLGVPILQGALSTMVAIFILASSNAYIFRVFFITLFLTMVFGSMHGLLFVPVVLSIIGPAPIHTDAEDKQAIEPSKSSHSLEKLPPPSSPKTGSKYDDVPAVYWPPTAPNNSSNNASKCIVLNGSASSWSKVPGQGSPIHTKLNGDKSEPNDISNCVVKDNTLSNYKRGSVTSIGDISNSVQGDEIRWSWIENSKETNL